MAHFKDQSHDEEALFLNFQALGISLDIEDIEQIKKEILRNETHISKGLKRVVEDMGVVKE